MGLLVYKFSEYDHTAEREQYRNLCKQLRAHYSSSKELCIFIANYNIFDSELDGIIIKQDAIICVEFKNYGGKVIASDNGNWKLDDGTIIKGGSRKSVYQQARINRSALKNGFKDGGILPTKTLRDVATLVVFHQAISLQNNLSSKTQSWLYVSDETNFMEKVCDITNSSMSLELEDMHILMAKLNLTDDYLDHQYSNSFDYAHNDSEEKMLEDSDAHIENDITTNNTRITEIEEEIDKDKEQLPSFVNQIVSILFRGENISVRILTLSQTNSELPAALYESVKSFRYIVLIHGERISTKAERLERFIHKKVYNIDANSICWGNGEMCHVDDRLHHKSLIQEQSVELSFRKSQTTLPHWLDKFLFEKLLAVYAPEYSRYEYNLDLGESEVRVYLGTYFPRSYAETFCIADNLFQNAKIKDIFNSLQNIRIFDFCAGTGGELIGLLSVLGKYFAEPKTIEIVACDGNEIALDKLSRIIDAYSTCSQHQLKVRIEKCNFTSEDDMARLMKCHNEFDFVLCSKVVCELISHGVVQSGYKGITRYLWNMLSAKGLLLMLDVTTKDEMSQRFYPQIMNSQINELIRESEDLETLLPLSCGTYKDCTASCFVQQTFMVTHRKKQKDESRVCYRILCNKNLKRKIWSKRLDDIVHIVNPQKYRQGIDGALCSNSVNNNKLTIDSYNIKLL